MTIVSVKKIKFPQGAGTNSKLTFSVSLPIFITSEKQELIWGKNKNSKSFIMTFLCSDLFRAGNWNFLDFDWLVPNFWRAETMLALHWLIWIFSLQFLALSIARKISTQCLARWKVTAEFILVLLAHYFSIVCFVRKKYEFSKAEICFTISILFRTDWRKLSWICTKNAAMMCNKELKTGIYAFTSFDMIFNGNQSWTQITDGRRKIGFSYPIHIVRFEKKVTRLVNYLHIWLWYQKPIIQILI